MVAACTDGDRMRRQLYELQARNQADSLMTDVSQATTLCRYFDNHGTPNERMLAHYLLARTYADQGEAPRALDEYHTAADCADTTAADCDYQLLSRVHGQAGRLFDDQICPKQALEQLNLAIRYARVAKDTIAVLNFTGQKIKPFHDLHELDSILDISLTVFQQYKILGVHTYSSYVLSGAIYVLLTRGEYAEAKPYIDTYLEDATFLEDTDKQAYGMSYLGKYYLGINEYDSASKCFYKELHLGESTDHLVTAYKGLYQIYQKTGPTDSLLKYVQLYGMANDSSVIFTSNATLQQMQGLYDYHRNQELATAMSIKARQTKHIAIILALFSALLIVIGLYVRNKKQQKYRTLTVKYSNSLAEYCLLKDEYQLLLNNQSGNEEQLAKLQEKINVLNQELSKYQEDKKAPNRWAISDAIIKRSIVRQLHTKCNLGKSATPEEFAELYSDVTNYFPNFIHFLNEHKKDLNEKEYAICILTKLRFMPYEQLILLGISSQSLTNMRAQLSHTLFNTRKSAKQFNYLILTNTPS